MKEAALASSGVRLAVLIISGNPAGRRRLADIAARGFEVVEARHGGEAIAILSTRSFDAVVLDLTLPRLRGTDVLAYYHGRYPERSNVIVSGEPDQLATIESPAVYTTVTKPLDIAAFEAVLGECARQQLPAAAWPWMEHPRILAERRPQAHLPPERWPVELP